MLKLVKKTAFIGLGLGAMSAATIKKIGHKIAEEGKLSEQEGEKLVAELLEQSKKSREEFQKTVETNVKSAVEEMDLAKSSDIKVITNRLDSIEGKLDGESTDSKESNGSNGTPEKKRGRPPKQQTNEE